MGKDKIYKVSIRADKQASIELKYDGDLNFSTENPIDCISYIEDESNKKVYWIDNNNQPRKITLDKDYAVNQDNQFDFLREVTTFNPNIQKVAGSGFFPTGTTQYVFTFIDEDGAETNIVHFSPQMYNVYTDIAVSPEGSVSICYKIEGSFKGFKTLRIYSICRSAINTVPAVKVVVDIEATQTDYYNNSSSFVFVDNYTSGYTISPSELLSLGGEPIIAKTFTNKDNTLFFGNITNTRFNVGNLVQGQSFSTILSNAYKQSLIWQNEYYYFEDVGGKLSYTNNQTYQRQMSGGFSQRDNDVTTFKSRQYYRLGLQFMHKTGAWSEAVYLDDYQAGVNTVAGQENVVNKCEPSTISGSTKSFMYKMFASLNLGNFDINKVLVDNGYVAARPIIVYPEIQDKYIYCQGVLNPTVANVRSREGNAPFAQSSWFFRPTFNDRSTYTSHITESSDTEITGEPLEYEFLNPLPLENTARNMEINMKFISTAGIDGTAKLIDEGFGLEETKKLFLSKTFDIDRYHIDSTIVTFHSPDVEFDNKMIFLNNKKDLALNFVGIATMGGFASNSKVITSPNKYTNGQNIYTDVNKKFYPYGASSPSIRGTASSKVSFPSFIESDTADAAYVAYPWQAQYSITGETDGGSVVYDAINYARIGNYKFSNGTFYFNPLSSDNTNADLTTNLYNNNGFLEYPLSEFKLFDFDDATSIEIEPYDKPSDSNFYGKSFFYNGNVDQIIMTEYESKHIYKPLSTYEFGDYNNDYTEAGGSEQTKPNNIKYRSNKHGVFQFGSHDYYAGNMELPSFYNDPTKENRLIGTLSGPDDLEYRDALGNNRLYWLIDRDWHSHRILFNYSYFTERNVEFAASMFVVDVINPNFDITTAFGGTSEKAIELNKWCIAGATVPLVNSNGALISAQVEYRFGDTFFQRYDCLKTFEYSDADYQGVSEVLSFICETSINLEGRYDDLKGNNYLLNYNPTKFNLINTAYSQANNFFTYSGLDKDDFSETKFPTLITWTDQKFGKSITDTWLKLNQSNNLFVDGNCGDISSLNTFNNQIIGFQKRGIFNVLYNERVQIPTNDGVPIQVASSGKVDGYKYITTAIGCKDKHAVIQSSESLYFIESTYKSLYALGGKDNADISKAKKMYSWFNSNINQTEQWNPLTMTAPKLFFDKTNNNLYITNKDYSLCYSEQNQLFTSFYSYDNCPFFINVNDELYSINKSDSYDYTRLWSHEISDDNTFYGDNKPFSISVLSNEAPLADKMFSAIHYKQDALNGNDLVNQTFDNIQVWNEYQYGSSILSFENKDISNLKKKFNRWHLTLPRSIVKNTTGDYNLNYIQYNDRIRNSWIKFKLTKYNNTNLNYKLYDIVTDFYV